MKYSLIFLSLIVMACGKEKIPQENTQVKIQRFNADSAYHYIQRQVDFGPRFMNTPEHEQCKDWLVDKLEEYNFNTQSQEFTAKAYDGVTLNGTNVIGRFNPHVKERLLLCAHYDTRHIADKDTVNQEHPIDGADDGGSGVGVLLEIARQIKNNPIPMGVDIIFFDAEDYGSDEPNQDYTWGLGSQYWSKNLHEDPYEVHYGILLDMVGAHDALFPKEAFSVQSARAEVDKIWKLGQKLGHGNHFIDDYIGFITDDHRFIIENTDIRMLNVIHVNPISGFGDHHHTHSDNMDIISKETLQAVGQTILATVYNESNKRNF